MSALSELAGVIVAAVAVFLGGIVFVAVFLLLWLMGMASALLLMVSAFSAVMYGFTGSHHAGILALTYLGYAAIPFVLTVVFHLYRIRLTGRRQVRRPIPDISGLRLARDADFNPKGDPA
jgi:hypothetical protein